MRLFLPLSVVTALALLFGLAGAGQAQSRPSAELKSVDTVVSLLGKRAGVLALADSTVAGERASLPPEDVLITPQNLDSHLAAMVATLEEGVVWARLYLPPPPPGKKWTGDDLAGYAVAQMRLYNRAGAQEDPGTLEIMGKLVPREQAEQIIRAMDLRPVYLVTRRSGSPTFHGTWQTTYGEMRLVQKNGRVQGTYTSNQGMVSGQVRGNRLILTWFEAGNNTGGTAEFTLSEEGENFAGTWRNSTDDSSDPLRSWTGKRISYKP